MLIVAANRLPVTLRRVGSRYEFEPAPGGLSTGLRAVYKEYGAAWVGWAGEVPASQRSLLEEHLVRRLSCHPIFLPRHLARRYYSGFSNRTLWPLFHSFPSYARYSEEEWEAYAGVNAVFRDRILSIGGRGDRIWIHDYHLLLLPDLLRRSMRSAKIGFFLHIPFPPYETFRLLPWHRQVLQGLLGADLIGFHTHEYAHAFLRSVRRALGHDHDLGRIQLPGRTVQVDVFPMGVDFLRFSQAAQDPTIRARIGRLRRRLIHAKILLSLSRLDYTKGLPGQLRSFQAFLEAHPEWRGRLVYVFIVVPSREKVDRYAQLKREIDELVGRINSRFGTFDWMPIRYIYRTLDEQELAALYAAADVALVAPLRDGMNLVAKEYIATKADGLGVLILSEMAGASKELREALLVNPNDEARVADAIHAALTMPQDEQIRRNRLLRMRLERFDVRAWGRAFLERLGQVTERPSRPARALSAEDQGRLEQAYARATRRLLLLDYDGTLVPLAARPEDAIPPEGVVLLLHRLASARGTEVFIASGRRRKDLEAWFASLPVHLVAEHGAWHRPPGSTKWVATVPLEGSWKETIRPILEMHAARVPGSWIEEKDFSLAWHYRGADPDIGREAAKELFDTLTSMTASTDLSVLPGDRVLEVKSSRIGKGVFFERQVRAEARDFVLAAGDDATDEELFGALPEGAHSIRVGSRITQARFFVESPDDVLRVLQALSEPLPR